MAVPDENVNPMDHFKDNFGQNFGPKRGSEVKTNSAVSFVSDMLDIKEKFDPQMFNSVAYRRTMSTLQEYNDVEKGKPRKNDVTPRFYENSGIKYIKENVTDKNDRNEYVFGQIACEDKIKVFPNCTSLNQSGFSEH